MWLRRTAAAWSKRTPGYVFWRQSTLLPLENVKRSYLFSEKPVPIAEVVRRMARVRARYEATKDFHERTLLRGEYKYFTGKPCDVRAARVGDLIAFLQCGAFFAFWDTAQVNLVMHELLRRLEELSANELSSLLASLPALRRQEDRLFRYAADELVRHVPELSAEECLRVCTQAGCLATAEAHLPPALLHRLLARLETECDGLCATQVVELLDAIAVMPRAVRQPFTALVDRLRRHAARALHELDAIDVAVLFYGLKVQDAAAAATTFARQLRDRFSELADGACAKSMAMMFSGVDMDNFGDVLSFSHAMASRVVFLATDYTPDELLAVLRVYVTALTSMALLAHGQQAALAMPTGATATAAPPRSAVAELELALQRKASLQHVVHELSAQLRTLLEQPSSYLSLPWQVEIVQLYCDVMDELAAGSMMSRTRQSDAHGEGTNTEVSMQARDVHAEERLLELLPHVRPILRLLSGKLIAQMPSCPVAVMMCLLQCGNTLGPRLLDDAVVAAALQELSRREADPRSAETTALADALNALTGLRAEHQRKIHSTLLPRLRGGVAG